jgi:AraC-like DNA-binding protein
MNQGGRFYTTEESGALYLYFMLRGQFQTVTHGQELTLDVPAKVCGMHYRVKGSTQIELPEGTHQVLHLRLKPDYFQEVATGNQHLPQFSELLSGNTIANLSLLHTCINPDINQEVVKLLKASGEKSHQLYKLYGTVDNILSHYFNELEGMAEGEEAILQRVAEKLRTAILEDPSNEHQLKHIAMEHKVDARSLSRLYRNKYNERLKDTRKEGIMVKAMSLITETLMTIEDIAYLLGYSDRRALSRAIKKELGQTPEMLRKNYRK